MPRHAAPRSPRRPFLAAAAASLALLPAGRATPAAAGLAGGGGRAPIGLLSDAALAGVGDYVGEALMRFGVPGAAVAVAQGGAVRFARGFGVAALGAARPVSPDTRFMIGSVPKSMTALLVATLVDEGRLAWDTPVAEVLPQFVLADPAATAAVTFRDLLSMRSGLPRFDSPLFLRPQSPEEVVESLAEVPLHARPGEAFAYSNQGFATAGFAAAVAAGGVYGRDLYATFARLMGERVFAPTGMGRVALDFDAGAADPDRAEPHAVDLSTGRLGPLPLGLERGGFSVIPAGGTTWASAIDLARYLLLHLGRGATPAGRRVVSEASLLETRRPHTPLEDGAYFGLGWIVGQHRGLEHVSYLGGNLGSTAYVSLLPAADLGVVVLTNASLTTPFLHAVADHVAEAALGLAHTAGAGHEASQREIRAALAQLGGLIEPRTDPAAVAGLLGRYGPPPGVQMRSDGAGGLALTTPFGDLPLYRMTGRPSTFLIGIGVGVTATFTAADRATPGGVTVSWLLGEPQPPLTLARTD